MGRAARMLCCLLVQSAAAAPVSIVASSVLSTMIVPARRAGHIRPCNANGAAQLSDSSPQRAFAVSRSSATANAAATSIKSLGKLILVRHGESTWNMDNKFTGWADVPLTDAGKAGAHRTAQVLRSEFKETVDVLYTSVLDRAVETARIIIASLESHGHPAIELRQRWRLNERHYGALTGLSKRESGCDDFELFRYRMTLAGRPPAMQPDHPYFTRSEAKYASGELLFVDPEPLALADVPLTESLADTCSRCQPVWEKELEPMIRQGVNVLVVGHANQLRALIQCVQQISDERQLMTLGVPNTMPLVYTFEHDGTPVSVVETGCFVSPLRGHYLGSECLEFNEIDTDGSGAVDAKEFRAAGFCDDDDECNALMDVADNNGDKLVDFKEFMAWEAKGRPKRR